YTWLAEEAGEIVAWTSIFPRDFAVDGRTLRGSIGCDAYVLPSHRRRGIAVALHRASRESMQRSEVPFRFMCGPPVVENLHALVVPRESGVCARAGRHRATRRAARLGRARAGGAGMSAGRSSAAARSGAGQPCAGRPDCLRGGAESLPHRGAAESGRTLRAAV